MKEVLAVVVILAIGFLVSFLGYEYIRWGAADQVCSYHGGVTELEGDELLCNDGVEFLWAPGFHKKETSQ